MTQITPSINKIINHLSHEFMGGPKFLRLNWVINFQKGTTLFWVLTLMWWHDNFSIQAWVYLVLHGSYGLIWMLKDSLFPDKRWQVGITFGGALMAVLLVLGPYWVAPYLLISSVLGDAHVGASQLWLFIAIFMYVVGLVLMLLADAQKFYTLRIQKGLITDGVFRFIRHPNYLGEMIVYGSFAVVVWHWIPWVILAWVWLGYFSINIIMKERSMSRYPEWAEYKKRSWYLIPYIF